MHSAQCTVYTYLQIDQSQSQNQESDCVQNSVRNMHVYLYVKVEGMWCDASCCVSIPGIQYTVYSVLRVYEHKDEMWEPFYVLWESM